MIREIVLDTETTGFDPLEGHRMVEIGCIELIDHRPTENVFHKYINPERSMPIEAYDVHGLSEEFLADKPVFSAIANDFLTFIGTDPLIIHNAAFDMRFINAELTRCKKRPLPMDRAIDTLAMARQAYPGAQASLDALCRRFGIDNSSRTYHGALLDSELLAAVYFELIGGQEPGLALANKAEEKSDFTYHKKRDFRPARLFPASDAEKEQHQAFVETLKDPIWSRYLGSD